MDSSTSNETPATASFDRGAAVTRSLLGYGVIAGPIYLLVGIIQAITRDGFDVSRHALSLLANGAWGWIQIVNLIVTGLMVVAAAVGFGRAMPPARSVGLLLGGFGVALVLSGMFRADPMDGFPPGTPDGAPETTTASGLVHLIAGGIGFLALAAAFVLLGRWLARHGSGSLARWSFVSAAIVFVGFATGAALATTSAGVIALWIAVVVGWAWLAAASVAVYRTVPHPDRATA